MEFVAQCGFVPDRCQILLVLLRRKRKWPILKTILRYFLLVHFLSSLCLSCCLCLSCQHDHLLSRMLSLVSWTSADVGVSEEDHDASDDVAPIVHRQSQSALRVVETRPSRTKKFRIHNLGSCQTHSIYSLALTKHNLALVLVGQYAPLALLALRPSPLLMYYMLLMSYFYYKPLLLFPP